MKLRFPLAAIATVTGLFVAAVPSAKTQKPATISGVVVSSDGQPIGGVIVSSSARIPAFTKTDEQGEFSLSKAASVLRLQKDGLNPLVVIVQSRTSPLRLTMTPETTPLMIPVCFDPAEGYQREGGSLGSFDVPLKLAGIRQGSTDIDYAVRVVQPKGSKATLALWFGPMVYAEAPDYLFVRSAEFSARNVLLPNHGLVGIDGSGQLPDGSRWRYVGTPAVSATYEGVAQTDAALFDQIINSICVAPDPKRWPSSPRPASQQPNRVSR